VVNSNNILFNKTTGKAHKI